MFDTAQTDAMSVTRQVPVARGAQRAATSQWAAGPLLYRFEAQLTFHPIGLVAEGLRMANTFDGRITHGMLTGARVWGIDHLLIRRDGVSIIDAPKTLSLGEQQVYEHVQGYCLPPDGLDMPPLEAVLDPTFRWPDTPFPVQAFSTFRTAVPALSHLNHILARVDGWASFATGRLVVETRVVNHVGVSL